ncbi:MAG TPA: aminotransferase class I/II-fold pyridoxal phosphate-dependent enzyme [Roseiflexaceae bacterium]|nr:aminotransferase class I/II-fold pyridoxal phosphate-dependent enzyme [Roseiflexaceae bacterium]
MTGWRLGYVAGPADVIAALMGIQSHSTTHTSSVTQAAVLPAYVGCAAPRQTSPWGAGRCPRVRPVM